MPLVEKAKGVFVTNEETLPIIKTKKCSLCYKTEGVKEYCISDVEYSKKVSVRPFCESCVINEKTRLAGLFRMVEIISDEDCAKENGRIPFKEGKIKGSSPPL